MADIYTVERTTVIDAPAATIFFLLVDFRQWRAWSPFELLDPAMERIYSGAPSGAGAVYEWTGGFKAGSGRMRIIESSAPTRLVVDQRNTKPFKSESTSTFSLSESPGSASPGSVSVVWSSTGPLTSMSRLLGVFTSMEKMVGPMFERGLAALKKAAEAG